MTVTMPRNNWDHTPTEEQIALARVAIGRSSPATRLANNAFARSLSIADLKFIALAVLQLSDENHELRERVRRLEERVGQ
jgi:hypothetical protein